MPLKILFKKRNSLLGNLFFQISIFILFILIGVGWSGKILSHTRTFPPGTREIYIAETNGIRAELLKNIAHIFERGIANGDYPGAVILIGHKGQIIYRGIFGNRRITPNIAPMQLNTIFDIASLTKVVATTPAIMQLIEQGKIDIDAPVIKYWPSFGKYQKNLITIRELLTHTSGLPANIPQLHNTTSQHHLLNQITQLKLKYPIGKKFLYSDINFLVLAHIIEIISMEPINVYASKHIFQPLHMNHTFFNPQKKYQDRIAPTELIENKLRWGKVHDPLAYALNGVAGNAGLFSDATDLGRYAQSLLNGGQSNSTSLTSSPQYFLGPLSIAKMTSPQTPVDMIEVRGLGWDIDSAYSNRGILFPKQSYGHTGWTGTSLWIDPLTQTWMVILTSRTHPHPTRHNQLIHDRRTIANIISASIVDLAIYNVNNTTKGELHRAYS